VACFLDSSEWGELSATYFYGAQALTAFFYLELNLVVVADFVDRYSPGGLKFSINDGGARPDTVSLRLAQAVRLMEVEQ
jgi:hypothetical protein